MYDGDTRITFDDRVLAHLEIVVINKLRRRESFSMSWRESADAGGGRNSIWLDGSIPLRFHVNGSRQPSLDRRWVERLAESASGPTGLIVMDDAGEPVSGITQAHGA